MRATVHAITKINTATGQNTVIKSSPRRVRAERHAQRLRESGYTVAVLPHKVAR